MKPSGIWGHSPLAVAGAVMDLVLLATPHHVPFHPVTLASGTIGHVKIRVREVRQL